MGKHEARCMKCKKQIEITELQAMQLKNGMWSIKGKHSECGTRVSKIVGKNKPEGF